MKKHIPNAITCSHLFSGCLGIVFAFHGRLDFAAYAVFIAAFLDFLDGMAARLLKVHSEIGKQLDSLADMVSFGVLPAVIIYHLFYLPNIGSGSSVWWYSSAFFIAVFSALRLAKFNIDTRQTNSFIGLPTPSGAMLSASFPLILNQHNAFFTGLILNHWFLLTFIVINCWLLVAELPLLALKFKNLDFKENIYRYILVFFAVVCLVFFKFAAIPVIIFFYIILSIIQIRTTKNEVSSRN
ncbi:CDP-diacylglycerol--serine O-phosphatidyltransferase [Mucilaginibacter arboris]|uniref:CDP-diacylglycerol--serine O-phosphatidyltransferase n=1 Tax=Mucilaginibacter arboris TaxID=2682090 RepID=A0A7K1SYA6_9SPHI|nr:CDP-diacylglycerol--serine O-phosphatidyltransferase [Mucilaginibacter arboris]MVN22304.1 CDP-diacylglycerol--serine O-phosphatidyltransferase [Mucilaginibacter arboris]